MNDKVLINMRSRAAHCRMLANSLTDTRAARSLVSMAEEIERDIQRWESDGEETVAP
jgi:hypothetical protein